MTELPPMLELSEKTKADIRGIVHKRFEGFMEDIGDELTESPTFSETPELDNPDNADAWIQFREAVDYQMMSEIRSIISQWPEV